MNTQLLTRENFREGVFARDGNKCVLCSVSTDTEPLYAHHIMERRLFTGAQLGGYYLANGASVCNACHILCEQTTVTVEEVRAACGITKPVLPEHLYKDITYDKWGNPCLPNGSRLRGELFDDESVQKILKAGGVLQSFISYVKYPRTWHMPWSPGRTKDDRAHPNMSQFVGRRVIVMEKMDGENTSAYPDHIHARSIDSANDPSRNYVKRMWSEFCGDIPAGWRICGENLYEKHSIHYKALQSYFMAFSIWDDTNHRLDFDTFKEWCDILGLTMAPVLYDGIYDEDLIKNLPKTLNWDMNEHEGYVITVADRMHYSEFKTLVAKFVRAEHVTEAVHVRSRRVLVANTLAVPSN